VLTARTSGFTCGLSLSQIRIDGTITTSVPARIFKVCPLEGADLSTDSSPRWRAHHGDSGSNVSTVGSPRDSESIVNESRSEVMLLIGIQDAHAEIALADCVPRDSITSYSLINLLGVSVSSLSSIVPGCVPDYHVVGANVALSIPRYCLDLADIGLPSDPTYVRSFA
jgi:hypothetical protein